MNGPRGWAGAFLVSLVIVGDARGRDSRSGERTRGMSGWGFEEVWSGEAVDQLLRGLGIDPRTVAYKVTEQSWSDDGHRREVLAVSDVTRRDEVQA